MFKKTYTEPAIYIEDVIVENGIAMSTEGSYIIDAEDVECDEVF
jgi:hypothetical protein